MAESELGVATLRIVADTRDALAALETLRAAVGRGVGNAGNFFSGLEQQAQNAGEAAARAISTALRGASAGINFNGIEAQAREAGVRASRTLRSALTSNAPNTRLSFGNIDEALGFAQALGGTVDDLREYRTALLSLRDGTSATAPGFSQLNNAIAEIGQTIRNFSSSSSELTSSLTRNRQAAVSPELRELATLYSRLEGSSRRAAVAQAELARGTGAVGASTEVATRRVQTFAQVLSQIPGASLESINRQIASLQEGLGGLSIRSQEFLQRLTGIAELEIIRDNRLNRQRANANFNAFSAARVGPDAFGGLPNLPPTVAGDLQLIDELNQRLRNVDQSSAEFEITQRALEQTQRRVQQALSGTSASFRELQQAEERAIRRREKLAGIQAYYADLNPRGGGVRNDSGALLARGANSASDERAYRAALGASRELLENDLARLQVLRQISQRILETAAATKGGFGSASATGFDTNDPIQKSIRRNAEKREKAAERAAKQEETYAQKMSQQEQDLAGVRAKRLAAQRKTLLAEERTALIIAKNREQFGSLPVSGRLPGGGAVPGSPAFKADGQAALAALQKADAKFLGRLTQRQDDTTRRGKDAIGSALIGGAFPLLFGQGLGASIGGGLGGFAGGLAGGQFGFGLSLIGTAIGQFADDLRKRAGDLAEALRSPAANFETLKQNFIFASRSQEEYVKALLESGQTAKATAVIQNEASRTFDPAQANLLSGSTDRLNRSWSDLSDRLGNFVAGPAAAFNDWLANIIKTVGGVPGQPQKVTGKEAVRNAGNQSLIGGGLLTGGLLAGAGALAFGGAAAAALAAAIPSGGLSLAAIPGILAALPGIAALGATSAGLGTGAVALGASGIGTVANADARRKVALDPTTIAGEKALEAIKARQLALENQIVQAKLAGRTALVEQLNIEARVTALNVQFAEAVSKINQDRAAGKITAEEAVRLQNQLVEATRAQKVEIAAQAAAAARTSAQQLKDAKALVGVYGTQRDILEEQQKVQAAQRTNDAAQAGLAAARARGATPEDLKIYENAARVAENNLLTVRVQAEEKIRQLETQRWADGIAAANKIAQIQRQTAITAQQRDVGSPGIQALQALEQLRAARDAEREAQARLRVRPGDQALLDAANQAAEQTKAAAESTRQTLIDAYTQAKDAARQIGRSIEDAANQLLRLQSGGDGLNAFLFGDARRQEQQTAFNALLPQFQQDRQTAASLYRSRGNESAALAFERLNFSGTLEQVNAQMLQFRQALQNQIRSEQDYQRLLPEGVRAQNALTRADQALSQVGLTPEDTIPRLLTSLDGLARKDWNVTVNVGSNGQSEVFGAAVNGGF